jgi:uncharacterized protein
MNAAAWLPVLPALLLELIFYFLPLFPGIRARIANLPRPWQAASIFLSGLLPITLLNLAQRQLPEELLAIAAALAIVCAWYFVLPAQTASDLSLLFFLTILILATWLNPAFTSPQGLPKLTALNKILWLRIGMLVFLFIRQWPIPRYGIWPNRAEWKEGTRQFAIFFTILLPVGLLLNILKFQLPKLPPWQLPLAFLAAFAIALCFVAFGEEFFFRGVLQRLATQATNRPWLSLVLTNILFGAVHLPFRAFPNWRFAILAAIAGIFYGLAFHRANSLRAAMVSHALLVATWTIFFNRSL